MVLSGKEKYDADAEKIVTEYHDECTQCFLVVVSWRKWVMDTSFLNTCGKIKPEIQEEQVLVISENF